MENQIEFRHITLPNKISIIFVPKYHYNHYFCSLGFNIGGYNNSYKLNNVNYDLPMGTAHFMEHLIFYSSENIFQEFTANGLEINAYTGPSHTGFHVEGTKNIVNAVKQILKLISNFKLNSKRINIERNLIKNELNLYSEIDEEKLIKNMILKMIKSNNYHIDICGTNESLKEINENIINFTYEHIYRNENMLITISGLFDKKDEENIIQELNLLNINSTNQEVALKNISKATLISGYEKFTDENSSKSYYAFSNKIQKKERLLFEICLKIIYKSISKDDKYLNIEYEINFYEDFIFSYIHSYELITMYTISKILNDLNEKNLNDIKKSLLLDYLIECDCLEDISYKVIEYWTYDINYFDFNIILNEINLDKLINVLENHFNNKNKT